MPTATLSVTRSSITAGGSTNLSELERRDERNRRAVIGSVAASASTSMSSSATRTYKLTVEGPYGVTVRTFDAHREWRGLRQRIAVRWHTGHVAGTIEAERFNDGAARIAYRDPSAGNAGGAFRNTDVDIEPATDSGGYDVGRLGERR